MKEIFQSRIFRFILSGGLAALLFFFCPTCLNKVILGIVLLLLLIFINASDFFSRINWLTQGSRILVGCLFIFSGLIKSNDPTGFSYKLEEYFDVFAEDAKGHDFFIRIFHLMHDASLFLAILVCVTEVALGFMLLIGAHVRLTLWLLLLQIVFFTFLTFYSACFNKVTHCGCFGDAIPLTPWQSFGKDLVLMVLITLLWVGKDNINPLMGPVLGNIATAMIIIGSIAFPLYTWYYLPVKDYRPYAPGLNLCAEMKNGPHYKPAVYRSHFRYKNKKTGKVEDFTDLNYPWRDSLNWAYDTALPATLEKPAEDEAKITDFKITDPESGEDLTDSILKNQTYYFFLVAYDLDKTNMKVQGRINDFVSLCDKAGYKFYGLTSTPYEAIRDFRFKVQAMYPYLGCDQTTLKTMIRSNPGLILMKGCNVMANWPYHSFPSFNDVKEKYMAGGPKIGAK